MKTFKRMLILSKFLSTVEPILRSRGKEANTTNPVIFSPGISSYQFSLVPRNIQENGVSASDLGRDEATHVQQKWESVPVGEGWSLKSQDCCEDIHSYKPATDKK